MNIEIYTELLKTIEQQQAVIAKLVNENAQLENALEVMCREISQGTKRKFGGLRDFEKGLFFNNKIEVVYE